MDTNKNILTLDSIAGYATEDALWQLLADLCGLVKDVAQLPLRALTPDRIIIDGRRFVFAEQTPQPIIGHQDKFTAPELLNAKEEEFLDGQRRTQAVVWTIGALLYYCSSGRYVFGGRGGSYQLCHPEAVLPSLRREHAALALVVSSCLDSNPAKRMTLEQLETMRGTGTVHHKEEKKIEMQANRKVVKDHYESCWPEAFVPLKHS